MGSLSVTTMPRMQPTKSYSSRRWWWWWWPFWLLYKMAVARMSWNYITANICINCRKKHTTALIPWPVDVQEVFEDIVGKPDYIMNVKYYTKSILIYIQNLIPFNKRVEKIEWISVASVFLLDFVKRWVRIACMYTLYTPRCFAISQVEANIKQSSGLMRALTRPNGHAGVNTLEATLHCNAKGAAVSG